MDQVATDDELPNGGAHVVATTPESNRKLFFPESIAWEEVSGEEVMFERGRNAICGRTRACVSERHAVMIAGPNGQRYCH